jgi:hypothetical protein
MMIAIDTDLHIPIYSPVCSYCRHLNVVGERCCAAYPEAGAIPMAIWLGEDNHTTPHEGDHGVMFEVIGTEERGEL